MFNSHQPAPRRVWKGGPSCGCCHRFHLICLIRGIRRVFQIDGYQCGGGAQAQYLRACLASPGVGAERGWGGGLRGGLYNMDKLPINRPSGRYVRRPQGNKRNMHKYSKLPRLSKHVAHPTGQAIPASYAAPCQGDLTTSFATRSMIEIAGRRQSPGQTTPLLEAGPSRFRKALGNTLDSILPPILISWAPFWLSESTLRALWAQTGPGTPKTSKNLYFELHFWPHLDPKGDKKWHMF